MKNKRLLFILVTVLLLISLPFIAMQFTNEVDWNFTDFAVMGGLLLSTGLLCEWVLRKVQRTRYRILLCGAVLLLLLLIWIELAVGIFGSPIAGS